MDKIYGIEILQSRRSLVLLLNYVVLRALWKLDVHLISTLVNKSLYYYYYYLLTHLNSIQIFKTVSTSSSDN